MTTIAATCRCDRPMPTGEDCSKCGKPITPPRIYRPRGTDPAEVERRAKMDAYRLKSRDRRKRVK